MEIVFKGFISRIISHFDKLVQSFFMRFLLFARDFLQILGHDSLLFVPHIRQYAHSNLVHAENFLTSRLKFFT